MLFSKLQRLTLHHHTSALSIAQRSPDMVMKGLQKGIIEAATIIQEPLNNLQLLRDVTQRGSRPTLVRREGALGSRNFNNFEMTSRVSSSVYSRTDRRGEIQSGRRTEVERSARRRTDAALDRRTSAETVAEPTSFILRRIVAPDARKSSAEAAAASPTVQFASVVPTATPTVQCPPAVPAEVVPSCGPPESTSCENTYEATAYAKTRGVVSWRC